MPPVQKVQILVLGDRDYPLHPTIKITSVVLASLEGLLTKARLQTPDLTYDDLVQALWSQGTLRVAEALDAGLRIERRGVILPPAGDPFQTDPTASKEAQRAEVAAKLQTVKAAEEFAPPPDSPKKARGKAAPAEPFDFSQPLVGEPDAPPA